MEEPVKGKKLYMVVHVDDDYSENIGVYSDGRIAERVASRWPGMVVEEHEVDRYNMIASDSIHPFYVRKNPHDGKFVAKEADSPFSFPYIYWAETPDDAIKQHQAFEEAWNAIITERDENNAS